MATTDTKQTGSTMKKFEISKGNGKVRVIYAPSRREKRRLQKLVPTLAHMEREDAYKEGVENVAHGFITGRNAVTCATQHIGFDTTITCDMSGWFDSVTVRHLEQAGVPGHIISQITIDGAVRQGLPTSPAAANLCAVCLDAFIMEDMRRTGLRFAYTRYADDITISLMAASRSWASVDDNTDVYTDGVLRIIARDVHAMDWKLADHKTHVYHSRAGRRPVVGVSVGPEDVRPTRATRRKVRASMHAKRKQTVEFGTDSASPGGYITRRTIYDFTEHQKQKQRGIQEWAECRLPRSARPKRQIVGLLASGGVAQMPSVQDATQQVQVHSGAGRRIVVEP